MLRTFFHATSIPWLIEPNYGMNLAAWAWLVHQKETAITAENFGLSSATGQDVKYAEMENGLVAVHTIDGVMMRDDQFCGPEGMMTIADRIAEADQNEDVVAHVVRMHTPGGTVEGTEILADVVGNTKKPLVAWGELIASAGVYVAAGADMVVLSGKNAQIGSVGVQITYATFKRYYDKEGVDFISLKASTSPDKNAFDFYDPAPSDEARQEFIQNALDPIDQHFMDHVRENRPQVEEEALTGKMYFAEKAIEMGLADQTGTFEDAVLLAYSLSQNQESKKMSIFGTKKDDTQQGLIEAKDQIITQQAEEIKLLKETIDQQAAIIAQQKVRIDTLGQLPTTDPEASPVSPLADTDPVTPEAMSTPAPESILKAVAESKRRTEYAAKKNKG